MTDDMDIPRHKTLKEVWWYRLKRNLFFDASKEKIVNYKRKKNN